MHKSKTKWFCLDCKENTSKMKEHYFVDTGLWMGAVGSEAGMLCVGCLEARLGRRLKPGDFPTVWINDWRRQAMSARLLSRIKGD